MKAGRRGAGQQNGNGGWGQKRKKEKPGKKGSCAHNGDCVP